MIIWCPECGRIRKFGKWIEMSERLREQIKNIPVLDKECNECERDCPNEKLISKIPGMNLLVQSWSWYIAIVSTMGIVGFILWGLGIL